MSEMIQFLFNNSQTSVLLNTTVDSLLQQQKAIKGIFLVVINGDIIPKQLYPQTTVKHGDELDIIVAISGG